MATYQVIEKANLPWRIRVTPIEGDGLPMPVDVLINYGGSDAPPVEPQAGIASHGGTVCAHTYPARVRLEPLPDDDLIEEAERVVALWLSERERQLPRR